MRILLTGGSGMVGKNILEHNNATEHKFLTPNSQELNLLDQKNIDNYFANNQIDLIIHCAGLVGGIKANLAQPVMFLNNNLYMGINLVNAALKHNIKQLINLGSSCMYPKDYKSPLHEEYILAAPLEPSNEGYALAKITVAKLCEYIQKQYGLNYKTLIPCNLYGRWDKFDLANSHMVPSAINKIYNAHINQLSMVDIWGTGNARREFMYTGDCADAIFFCMDNLEAIPQYTNIGLGYDYSINEYYQYIADIIGYTGEFAHDLSKPEGMQHKLTSASNLTNMGWKPTHNLIGGLKNTIEFYRDNVYGKN